MKFLVVDDSTTMRNIMKKCLRKAGYENHDVIEAKSGPQAIELIASESPDLLITDIDMPEMTGLEMVEQLQSKGIHIRFGVASAQSGYEIILQAMELGARFMLKKPFDAAAVKQAMQGVVRDLDDQYAAEAERERLENKIAELTRATEALEKRIDSVPAPSE